MARNKTRLNRIIDETMGILIEKRGRDGFGYEEIMLNVRTKLGDALDVTLRTLGEERLKDKIRDRASKIAAADLAGSDLNPRLDLGDAALVYPVKNADGATRFKKITHFIQEDMDHVIGLMVSQLNGTERHVRSLRRIALAAKPIWDAHPDWTLDEVQASLDDKAA